jgi:hypothetical protein
MAAMAKKASRICPTCGGEMEVGTLVTMGTYRPRWVPRGRLRLASLLPFRGERVGKGRAGGFSPSTVPRLSGFRCTNCRELVLGY